MSINWFEGGRRITKLFMAIAALIGAYNAYFEFSPPALEFSTTSPLDPWKVNLPSANAADWEKNPLVCGRSENIWDFEIAPGLVRHVSLCFTGGLTDAEVSESLAKQRGLGYFDLVSARAEGYSDKDIAAYLFATLRLDDSKKRLKDVEAALSRATRAGDVKGSRELTLEGTRLRAVIKQRQEQQNLISSGSETELSGWEDQRIAEFGIDPEMVVAIEKELPRIEREALWQHAKEVLSTTAYFIGGFWLFSFVIGWIVRGFAGIPRGQDIRPEPIKN
jgi:hypothetical protein